MKDNINKDIAEEVEKTMALLDTRVEIEADSWFYTRLRAKLSEKDVSSNTPFSVLLKPALLLVFLLINIAALFYVFNRSEGVSAQRKIAEEYSLTLNSYELLDLNLQQGE